MVDYDDLKLCAARLTRNYEAGSIEDQEHILSALARCTQEEAQEALQGGFELVLNLLSNDPSEQVVTSYIEANGLREAGSLDHYQ